jgi:hypothetical protein
MERIEEIGEGSRTHSPVGWDHLPLVDSRGVSSDMFAMYSVGNSRVVNWVSRVCRRYGLVK